MTGPALSPEETDYLQRLAQGDTIQQIAQAWHYSDSGARTFGEHLRKKLGAKTNAQAVFIACRLKILEPNRRHGDHAGFIAHQRRGEDAWACEHGCPEGERAYRQQRRQQRKAA